MLLYSFTVMQLSRTELDRIRRRRQGGYGRASSSLVAIFDSATGQLETQTKRGGTIWCLLSHDHRSEFLW
jgi:hypothetical protein